MTLRATCFTLNCSRVGLQGGLKTFADEVMQAMIEDGVACRAILPAGYPVPRGVEAVFTPASLAGNSNLSVFRPIKWLTYSRFYFPVAKQERILSTTHQVLPGRAKQIVTIHDLRPYFIPDTSVQQFYFQHFLPRALNRCDGILTVSETSRQLIAEVYRISMDRIAVVHNSIRPVISQAATSKNVEEPYLLTVGASWAHKNIEEVLHQEKLWSGTYSLKVVAGPGQYRSRLEQLASNLGVAARVEFLSNLDSDQLNQLYAGCSALVYPSLMEGFGLPPLEAMARMRPAIVADLPVFRELYGCHAIYIQLGDSASWEKALEELTGIETAQLVAARDHALSYDRRHMVKGLHDALDRFWPI